MAHDNPFDPQGHELWPAFVKFLDGKGIPVEETKAKCSVCRGSGLVVSSAKVCPVCNNSGVVPHGGREQWIKWWQCFVAGAQIALCMVGYDEDDVNRQFQQAALDAQE